jgi:hypothetical protein
MAGAKICEVGPKVTLGPEMVPRRHIGLRDVEAPTLYEQTIGLQMAVRLSEFRAGRPLPPQEDSWYSFLLEA